MKRRQTMLLLVAILFLLLACYLLFSWGKGVDTSGESITVAMLAADTVTQMSWEYQDIAITLVREGDSWSYQADSAFPLNTGFADKMLEAVTSVAASKKLIEPAALTEYGLDTPQCIIKVTNSDKTSTVFKIGNSNMNGDYYLTADDGATVYLTDSTLLEAFSYSLNDLAVSEDLPYITDLSSLIIERGAQQLQLVYLSEGSEQCYSSSYTWFIQEDEQLLALDSDAVHTLTNAITGIMWYGCVNYQADSDELAQYGLDEPQAVVTVNYTETETEATGETDENGQEITKEVKYDRQFFFCLGNKTGDYYYAMLPGSQMVYQVSGELGEVVLGADYTSLQPDEVCAMDWDTVEQMTVSIDDSNWNLQLKRNQATDDNGDNQATVTYLLDGEETDTTAAAAFLASINALSSEGQTTQPVRGDAALSITFTRNTASFAEMTWSLYSYDASFYQVAFNGESRLLINKNDALAIKKAWLDFIQE